MSSKELKKKQIFGFAFFMPSFPENRGQAGKIVI